MPFNKLVDPKHTATHTWCEIRGVPRGIIHGKYDTEWVKFIRSFDFRGKPVSRRRQYDWWNRTNDDIFEGTPLIGVVGTNQTMIEQVAFYMWLTAYYQSDPNFQMPYWHAVTGSKSDDLRDGNGLEFMAPINFLVVSNVGANASFAKTEKVRDIVSLYDYVPRVLVISAKEPVTFFTEQLLMTPTRMIFVDDLA